MEKLEVLKPIHPGGILKTEFLEVNNVSLEQLSIGTKLNKSTWGKLLREEIPITYELALRLSLYFDTSLNFWLNLQRIYEEKTSNFIKKSLNQTLTDRNKRNRLKKEVQDSLVRNIEIRNKFQEKTIWARKSK